MNDVRGTIRIIRKTAAMAVMVAAGLAMLAADAIDDVELFRLAVTAWLIAATTYAIPRTGITMRIIERARDEGYDDGFASGCKAAISAGLAGRPLTLLRAPKQLTQEGDLASGMD